jgi:hypothetical protein
LQERKKKERKAERVRKAQDRQKEEARIAAEELYAEKKEVCVAVLKIYAQASWFPCAIFSVAL